MAFTLDGYQPESLSQIITDINSIFINVFGPTVNLNAASPNGQFINQLANVAVNNQNFMVLLTASLYNPDVATTVWLDAIASFNGLTRLPATYSEALCTCYGSVGVNIPIGTQITNTNGDVFAAINAGTIGYGGSVDIIFEAVNTGAVSVTANTLTVIVNQIYGWDSVTNAADGTIGAPIQSDASFRQTRSNLLAFQGSASLGSIYAAVYSVPEVTDVFVAENNTLNTTTVQGVSLAASSIYVAVIGGSDNSIAGSIYQKKAPGVGMNGNTTTVYTDPVWNNTFSAIYERPTPTVLQVDVSIRNSSTFPVGFATLVQNTIVNNFNGVDTNVPSMAAVKIGQIINVSRFYPSLIAIGAWDILSLTIQLHTAGTPAVEIQLPVDQIGTLIVANVNVSLV